MSLIFGGAFCAGAFTPSTMTVNSPDSAYGGSNGVLGGYTQLANDPLGRPYNVLKCRINQSAYNAGAPIRTYTYRAELNSVEELCAWGTEYTYYWRFTMPLEWVSLGASADIVVAQLHEAQGDAGDHQPTFAIHLLDNVLTFRQCTTANPTGVDFYSLPVTAGQEVEIFARINWADGAQHVAAALGIYEWTVDGVLVFSDNGAKNTWDGYSGSDPDPPWMKCGVYQSAPGESWWAGKEAVCYYAAMACGSAAETLTSIRAYVDAQLAASNNRNGVASY